MSLIDLRNQILDLQSNTKEENLDIEKVLEFNQELQIFNNSKIRGDLVHNFNLDKKKLLNHTFDWEIKYQFTNNNEKGKILNLVNDWKNETDNENFLSYLLELKDEFILRTINSNILASILDDELIFLYLGKEFILYTNKNYQRYIRFQYKILTFYINFHFLPKYFKIPELDYNNLQISNFFIRNKIRENSRIIDNKVFNSKKILDLIDIYFLNLNYYWVNDQFPIHIKILEYIVLCFNYGLYWLKDLEPLVKKLNEISENLINLENYINEEEDETLKSEKLNLNSKTKNLVAIILSHIIFLVNDEQFKIIFSNENIFDDANIIKNNTEDLKEYIEDIDANIKFSFENKLLLKRISFLLNNYVWDNDIEMNKLLLQKNNSNIILKNYIYYLQEKDFYHSSLKNINTNYLYYIFGHKKYILIVEKKKVLLNIEEDLETIIKSIKNLTYSTNFLLNFDFRKDFLLSLAKIIKLFDDDNDFYIYAIVETNILDFIYYILNLLLNSNLSEYEQKINDMISITIFTLNKIFHNNSFSQIQIYGSKNITKLFKKNTKINLKLITLLSNSIIKELKYFGQNKKIYSSVIKILNKKILSFSKSLKENRYLNSSYSNLGIDFFEILPLCYFMNNFFKSLIHTKNECRILEIEIQVALLPVVVQILDYIYNKKIKINDLKKYELDKSLGFEKPIDNLIIYYEKIRNASEEKKLRCIYDIFYYVINLFKNVSTRFYTNEVKSIIQKEFNSEIIFNLFRSDTSLLFFNDFLEIYFLYNFNCSNYECNKNYRNFFNQNTNENINNRHIAKEQKKKQLIENLKITLIFDEENYINDGIELNENNLESLLDFKIFRFLENLFNNLDIIDDEKKGYYVGVNKSLKNKFLSIILNFIKRMMIVFNYYNNNINLYPYFNYMIKHIYELLVKNQNIFLNINPNKAIFTREELLEIKGWIVFYENVKSKDPNNKEEKNKKKKKNIIINRNLKKNLKESEKLPHLNKIINYIENYLDILLNKKKENNEKNINKKNKKNQNNKKNININDIQKNKNKIFLQKIILKERWKLFTNYFLEKKQNYLETKNEFLLNLENGFGENGNNLVNLIKFLLLYYELIKIKFIKQNDLKNDNHEFFWNNYLNKENYELDNEKMYLLYKQFLTLTNFFSIIIEKFSTIRNEFLELLEINNYDNEYYSNFIKFIIIYLEWLFLTKNIIIKDKIFAHFLKSLDSMSIFFKILFSNNFERMKKLVCDNFKNNEIIKNNISLDTFQFENILEIFFYGNYFILLTSKYESNFFKNINHVNDEEDLKIFIYSTKMIPQLLNGSYEVSRNKFFDLINDNVDIYKKILTNIDSFVLSNFFELQNEIINIFGAFFDSKNILKYIKFFETEFLPSEFFNNIIILIKYIIVEIKLFNKSPKLYQFAENEPNKKISEIENLYVKGINISLFKNYSIKEFFVYYFNILLNKKRLKSDLYIIGLYQSNSGFFSENVMKVASKYFNILSTIANNTNNNYTDYYNEKIHISRKFCKYFKNNKSKIKTINNISLQSSPKGIPLEESFYITNFMNQISLKIQIIDPYTKKKIYYPFLKIPITFFISDYQIKLFVKNIPIENINSRQNYLNDSFNEFYIHSSYGFRAANKSKLFEKLTSITYLKNYQIFLYIISLGINIGILFGYNKDLTTNNYVLSSNNRTIFNILNFVFMGLNWICLILWFIFKYIKNREIEKSKYKIIEGLDVLKVYVINSILYDKIFLSFFLHIVFTALWFTNVHFFINLNLLLIVNFFDLMNKVLKSVTLYYNYLLATFFFLILLIYSFSILVNINYEQDFRNGIEDGQQYDVCFSLFECFLNSINIGLREDGIGEVLNYNPPSSGVGNFFGRYFLDFIFFFLINLIVLNIVSGIIIDTFSTLRDQESTKQNILNNECLVCGENKKDWEIKNIKFEKHTSVDHNLKFYIYFLVYLFKKNKENNELSLNNIEKSILEKILENDSTWIPTGFLEDDSDQDEGLKKIKKYFENFKLEQEKN